MAAAKKPKAPKEKGALLIGIGEPPPDDELDLEEAKDMAANDLSRAFDKKDPKAIRAALETFLDLVVDD